MQISQWGCDVASYFDMRVVGRAVRWRLA